MDIREKVKQLLPGIGKSPVRNELAREAKLLGWETGLGPVMNAAPDLFGQQAVIYFPGRSRKFAFPCHEHNGRILLAVKAEELAEISEQLIQSPGIEIWLKSGWFAGTIRQLPGNEQKELEQEITDSGFFGTAGKKMLKQSLEDHFLLEVTRTAPCTGSSGPGSKAWVWPVAAFALFIFKKKK